MASLTRRKRLAPRKPASPHIGKRVELHPGTDRWMMGDKYGTVESVGRTKIGVRMDKSRKLLRFAPDRIKLVGTRW